MAPMTLIHLTNHQGDRLDASHSAGDPDLETPALWFQAVEGTARNAAPCCPSYGCRTVCCGPGLMRGWLGRGSTWSLYLIKERKGNNDGHNFYKYVLTRDHSPGDTECEQTLGLVPVFYSVRINDVWDKVQAIFAARQSQDIFKNHVHIGICGFENPLRTVGNY